MDRDTHFINYNVLIERAMRDVVKYVLKKIQKSNSVKNYCFVFHIDTNYKGVILPNYIKLQYPHEITLILQHQFDNLVVRNNSFSVNLSFSGKMEHVVIPFGAIMIFSDQEAGIELRFDQCRYDEILDDEMDDFCDNSTLNHEQEDVNNLIDFNSIKKADMTNN